MLPNKSRLFLFRAIGLRKKMPREGGREDNRPVAHTVSSPLTLGSIGFEPDEVHHVLAETAAIQLDHPAVVPTTTSIYINWNDLNINKFGLYGTIYLLAADSLLYPIDLFTTRLQADKVRSIFHCRVCPLLTFVSFPFYR